MASKTPEATASNAHFLKGHASWLYCDSCHNTVAYLCYVTYRYFKFSFTCKCGSRGWVENKYDGVNLADLVEGTLTKKAATNRYGCSKDDSPLFSPVPKNLESYDAEIVCKQCDTRYKVNEKY